MGHCVYSSFILRELKSGVLCLLYTVLYNDLNLIDEYIRGFSFYLVFLCAERHTRSWLAHRYALG